MTPFTTVGAFAPGQTIELGNGIGRQTTVTGDGTGRVTALGNSSRAGGSLQIRLDGQRSIEAARVAFGGRSVTVDAASGDARRAPLPADDRFRQLTREADGAAAQIVLVKPEAFAFDHMLFGYWADLPASGQGFAGAGAFGTAAPAASVPGEGSATYNGATVGAAIFADGSMVRLTSNVALVADFSGNRVELVTSTPIDAASGRSYESLRVTGDLRIDDARLSGNATAAGGWQGPIDGRFFGADASEVGGAFDLAGSGLERYVAGFGAKR